MRNVLWWISVVLPLLDTATVPDLSVKKIREYRDTFANDLLGAVKEATQVDELIERYQAEGATVNDLKPELVVDQMRDRLEAYLNKRRSLAKHLKDQLENARATYEWKKHEQINEPCNSVGESFPCSSSGNNSYFQKCRYFDAKNHTNGLYIGRRNRSTTGSGLQWVPEIDRLELTKNPNFFGMEVDLLRSAVHVPTPIWPRNETIANEICWSQSFYEIGMDARSRNFTSASWLMFCSRHGFMRYYPAARWVMDNDGETLDLFDCRTQEWYIDGATTSKNVIILLDVSGSMLGQRFEIAKRTVDAILETLSENDFFNILTFSHEIHFLYQCFNQSKLVQASIRNKRLMKQALDKFVNISNIANFTNALTYVFELIHNKTNGPTKLGCNSAIMLITDGADDYYKHIFDEYNPDRKIRFFSFLMGEDVTAFRQVLWMACNNSGYFAHVANVADVQEKVQKYIDVMSSPLALLNETNAAWTGAYFDRLSRRLVTTVAFPVIFNKTFLGVVGAAAPIAELQQRAPVYMLGANSYTFLVDNNGYILFHPQHRPIHHDKKTRQELPKPNYNSMDILEMEVADHHSLTDDPDEKEIVKRGILDPPLNYNLSLRMYMVDARDSTHPSVDVVEMTVLRAMEEGPSPDFTPMRVYRQRNRYHFRAIRNTQLSLGLAVPIGSEYRVNPPSEKFNLKDVKMDWFEGNNWRLHPDWHYCRPNDTDMRQKHEVFRDYVAQMQNTHSLPDECTNVEFLINRLLFDAKVTCDMDKCWIRQSAPSKNNGILLAFLATQTGLTRFVDLDYTGITCPQEAIENGSYQGEKCCGVEQTYLHFIERSTRAVDELFYKRAMQFQDGEFVFDVNVSNKVCLKNNISHIESRSTEERESMLITASRAVFLGQKNGPKAPVGVVGIEMLYTTLGKKLDLATNGVCRPENRDYTYCVLLDEHAHVVYSSVKNLPKYLVDEDHVGKYFGNTGFIHYHIMKNIEKDEKIYEKVLHVDFQAMCNESVFTTTSASYRILNPLFSVIKFLLWALRELSTLLAEYSFWSILNGIIMPSEAFTPSTPISDVSNMAAGVVCDKAKYHHLLKSTFTGAKQLFDISGASPPPGCKKSECTIAATVARVNFTNLLLVVYHIGGHERCQPANEDRKATCLVRPSREYYPLPISNGTDKVHDSNNCAAVKPRYRRHPGCYTIELDANFTQPACRQSGNAFRSIADVGQMVRRLLFALSITAASRFMLTIR